MPSAASARAATAAYSSGESPKKLTTTCVRYSLSWGSRSPQERLDADVLEPDRVQHAGCGLDEARRRVSRHAA